MHTYESPELGEVKKDGLDQRTRDYTPGTSEPKSTYQDPRDTLIEKAVDIIKTLLEDCENSVTNGTGVRIATCFLETLAAEKAIKGG